MARPFNVTTAADSVRLDAQGRGATTITVSNISGKPRRGRARLVPGDPAQASWLAVEGEAERDFTADGTHQFVARIAVPAGTPAGKFTFGVDVVSVENPDEEFTQGPKIAFEVAPPPAKKPFPWWILVALAAVLLVGGLVAWLVLRPGPPPPPPDDGKKGLQEACKQDGDCRDQLFCFKEAAATDGVCLGKVGFPACHTSRDCGDGLTCEGKVCKGKLQFAGCQGDADCASGLTCQGNKCLAQQAAACTTDADCASQLCRHNLCVAKTLAEHCNVDTDCAASEACFALSGAKVCLRRVGQACASLIECLTQNCGPGNTCLPAIGTGPCIATADCASPRACVTNLCVLPDGQHCNLNSDCQSANCSGGTCQPRPCFQDSECGPYAHCVKSPFIAIPGHCQLKFNIQLMEELKINKIPMVLQKVQPKGPANP